MPLWDVRIFAWCLCTLVKYNSEAELVISSLDLILSLIYTNDDQVLLDTLHALSNILNQSSENVEFVFDSSIIRPKLFEFLQHSNP